MKKYCKNHPSKKAISFCHICKYYYCIECLNEGIEYYYCNEVHCYEGYKLEMNEYMKNYKTNPRFCAKCIEESLSVSIGKFEVVNGTGANLNKVGFHCDICNSYIAVSLNMVLGIPVKFNDYYRVIQLETSGFFQKRSDYLVRKLKDQSKYELK